MTLVPPPEDALFVDHRGEESLVIRHVDRLKPFLVSVVSADDHWLFASSRGAVTLGREHADNCLLPYETDDRLHRNFGLDGVRTLLRVRTPKGGTHLWMPFCGICEGARQRSIYKSSLGDWIELEERAEDLGLSFAWRWSTSPRYGFVRQAWLTREAAAGPLSSAQIATVELLDGLLGVMPAGVALRAQQSMSTLVDAYKRSELDPDEQLAAYRLGLYTLEAELSDRAQAVESLRTNVLWSRGLGARATVSLCEESVELFGRGERLETRSRALGQRGAYLLVDRLALALGQTVSWQLVADVGLDHVGVEALRAELRHVDDATIAARLDADIASGRDQLRAVLASADAQQQSADRRAVVHHQANTLFNAMRGGVFADHGRVPVDDFSCFLAGRHRRVFERHEAALRALAGAQAQQSLESLHELAERTNDVDLQRLVFEYLPLYFSRRHGDPSRPWNRFAIRLRNPDGSRRLAYEGNWRDIFQNWEPLLASFPLYHLSVIAKFVNASTADGHNPYRITDEGIDWEVPEPDEPWANIGYWGDHQVAYLLRLLESCEAHQPGALVELLPRRRFSYADVPYRIAPYEELLAEPKSTIRYDEAAAKAIARRCEQLGADGKLLCDPNGAVLHVTLAEKLVVPALAKLSNLVADGGIWMNTQRPEWNDANNALVGQGLSMVTLCYLRRYLALCARLFARLADETPQVAISGGVARWIEVVGGELRDRGALLEGSGPIDGAARRALLDAVGRAYGRYRARLYEEGPDAPMPLAVRTLEELCTSALPWLDHAIAANRRDDGLLHAYNLVTFTEHEVHVDHTYEMLEGQVALLATDALDGGEALALLEALEAGRLYREDQQSYLLYPVRELPSFVDKNRVPTQEVEGSPLLSSLLATKDRTVISGDASGGYRFAAALCTAAALDDALDRLSQESAFRELVAAERGHLRELYERVFGHRAFMGRSGTMYKYEGIGSIYWHMVAKLLLAVQETFWRIDAAADQPAQAAALARAYYRLRGGLGVDKSPEVYGAFPTDPYSHSPAHLGAQQPGMTGQVKEGVLLRRGELGVRVAGGRIGFEPRLLRPTELLPASRSWRYLDIHGARHELELAPASLAFTVCQVPVVYRLGESSDGGVAVVATGGERRQSDGTQLDLESSRSIFARDGRIERVEVEVPRSLLILRETETA